MRRLRAGIAALALVMLPGAASAMSYTVVSFGPDRGAIAAEGAIEPNEGQRFVAFLRSAASQLGGSVPRTLLIHSPGGVVEGSLQLGLVLRQLGYGVMVARARRTMEGASVLTSGHCASACVYALMGGTKRLVPAESRIFVHRPRAVVADFGRDLMPPNMKPADPTNRFSLVRSYASAMGIRPDLVDLSYAVPHESNRLLTPTEVRSFRLTNSGNGPAAAPSPRREEKRRAERRRRPA